MINSRPEPGYHHPIWYNKCSRSKWRRQRLITTGPKQFLPRPPFIYFFFPNSPCENWCPGRGQCNGSIVAVHAAGGCLALSGILSVCRPYCCRLLEQATKQSSICVRVQEPKSRPSKQRPIAAQSGNNAGIISPLISSKQWEAIHCLQDCWR